MGIYYLDGIKLTGKTDMTIIAYDGRYLVADSYNHSFVDENGVRCGLCNWTAERVAAATTKITLINGASSYKGNKIVATARSGRKSVTDSIEAMLKDGLSIDAFLNFMDRKSSPMALTHRDLDQSSLTVIFEDRQCGTLMIEKDGSAKFTFSNSQLMDGCGLYDVAGIENLTGRKLTAIQRVRLAIESNRGCGGDIHYIDMNEYPDLRIKIMKAEPLGKTPAERWSALLSYKPKG